MTAHRITYNQKIDRYRVERRMLFWWTVATETDESDSWGETIPVIRRTMEECEAWIANRRKPRNRWEPVERLTNL